MRKRYTAAFKAQVVLELLKEERPVSKISSEYGVHANQLYQWKAQALKNLPRLFDEEQAKAKANQANQANQKLDELYAEIGRLTVERLIQGYSKKALGFIISWHSLRTTYLSRSVELEQGPAVVIPQLR